MAILASGELSFEFRYARFENGWLRYHFYFKWQGESLVRDDLLKKTGEYWGGRPSGALLANEHEKDGFIPLLRHVLDTDTAEYWEPIESDIIVAIYPEEYFPFLPSHRTLVYESPEMSAEREARSLLKREKGKLPDDTYTMIVLVNAYNFKGSDAYYGEGLSLQLIISRRELEEFTLCLEREYQEFRERFMDGFRSKEPPQLH